MDLKRWLETHPYLAPIARVEAVVAEAGGPAPAIAEPRWEAYRKDYQQGVSLLRSGAAGIDLSGPAAEVLGRLIEALAESSLPQTLLDSSRALRGEFRRDPGATAQVIRGLVAGEEEGGRPPAQRGLLFYLGWTAVSRALAPVVSSFERWREEEAWNHGHCPTCGASPLLAWLEPGEAGRRRRLICGCCATRWSFRRIGCPRCGNDDSGRLAILEVEGEEGLRLDFCENCKGYLKTYSGSGDPPRWLADWTTLHLDIIARQRGYQRKGNSLYQL